MTGLSILSTSLFGLVAKATLILCVALALAWFTRRSSARTLHLLWTATFVALLALPGASLLAPSWELPVLPIRTAPAPVPAGDGSPRAPASRAPASDPPAALLLREAEPQPNPSLPVLAGPPSFRHRGDAPVPRTAAGGLLILWALGCGAGLVSLGVGALRFRSLVLRATPLDDPVWIQSANRLRRRLRVRIRVRLLASAKLPAPMTGGFLSPVILLPESATEWTASRREAVLSHELVHLRRRDAVRQLAGRVALALYWFHPLAWIAWRRAVAARERSCDEEVLALGVRPSAYARHLLALASGLASRPPVHSLPMAQRSHLENRIMLILKPHRPHFSRIRTCGTLSLLAGAGVLVACARPVPIDSGPVPPPPAEEIPIEADPAAAPALPENPSPRPAPPPETPPAEPVAEVLSVVAPSRLEPPRPLEAVCNPGAFTGIWRDRESTTLQVTVEGMSLCMRTQGDVAMSGNGAAVVRMEPGSLLVLASLAARRHLLVISPGAGGPEYAWSVDGRAQPFDDEAREWRDLVFTVLAGFREAWAIRSEEGSLRREIGSRQRHVAGLRRDIGSHERHVAALRRKIASHERHVAGLHRDIASHERHVAGLRRDIGSHERHVAGLRRDIASHERQVAGLQRDIGSHERHVAGLHRKIASRQRKVASLNRDVVRAGRSETQEASRARAELAEVESELRRLRQAVEDYDLERRVREVGREIDRYDLDGKIREIEAQIRAYDLEGRIGEIESRIQRYDLEGRTRAIESQIEQYDLEGRIRTIESEIEQYDLDGRIGEIEARIRAYDLDEGIREIESQIEELDADRRAGEVERSIQDEIAALKELIG